MIHFDVVKMNTKKSLRFVYTKNITDEKFEIIDDFGYGVIFGSSFVSDNDILLKKATFAIAPKDLLNK